MGQRASFPAELARRRASWWWLGGGLDRGRPGPDTVGLVWG